MKLTDKIEKLELAIQRMKTVVEVYPDIEVVQEGDVAYYCSATVMRTAEDVEFLTPKNINNSTHSMCVYKDIMATIGKEPERLRVYGYPCKIKLFTTVDSTINCHDYVTECEVYGVRDVAVRKSHVYVVDFIRDSKLHIQKDKLPKNISNLLAFL